MSASRDHTASDDLDEDGLPVGRFAPGQPLPGGLPAWERLGVGQRCETWLAWSAELWCPAVLKFPRPHQLDHPRARRALQREIAALKGNLHPALPRLYTDGTGAGVPFVVSEYVDGPALDDDLDEHGPLAPAEVALIGVRLLSALHSVHAHGLVHVDVKPENVVLRDGRAVLLDFGSARPIGSAQPAGALIGSPGYAAPELEDGARLDPAMDAYGVGVTLHEALTGRAAFDPSLAAGERPRPPALPVSPLSDVIEGLIEPDATDRPPVEHALRTLTRLADPDGEIIGPSWAVDRTDAPTAAQL